MAPPRKATVVDAPPLPVAAEALPLVECIGVAKVARGWVVVAVTTQGDKVLDKEVLSQQPEPKPYAVSRAQTELVKWFLAPRPGVGA